MTVKTISIQIGYAVAESVTKLLKLQREIESSIWNKSNKRIPLSGMLCKGKTKS
jgi:hypothetical protein